MSHGSSHHPQLLKYSPHSESLRVQAAVFRLFYFFIFFVEKVVHSWGRFY